MGLRLSWRLLTPVPKPLPLGTHSLVEETWPCQSNEGDLALLWGNDGFLESKTIF